MRRPILLALCLSALLATPIAFAESTKRDTDAVDRLPAIYTKQTLGKSGEFVTLTNFSNDPTPDCTVSPASPAIRIVKLPANGAVFLQTGTKPVQYPAQNPLAACNGKSLPTLYVVYRSNAGFHGTDSLAVALETGTEGVTKLAFTVTVE